jgi:hypothetical protein
MDRLIEMNKIKENKVTYIKNFQRKGLAYGSTRRLAQQWGCTQFDVIEKIMKITGISSFEEIDKMLSSAKRKNSKVANSSFIR